MTQKGVSLLEIVCGKEHLSINPINLVEKAKQEDTVHEYCPEMTL
jgi:hypothetical protein